MPGPRPHKAGAAEGDDFSDICRDPACPACSLWPRPDETRERWLARLGALYRAAPFVFKERQEDR